METYTERQIKKMSKETLIKNILRMAEELTKAGYGNIRFKKREKRIESARDIDCTKNHDTKDRNPASED